LGVRLRCLNKSAVNVVDGNVAITRKSTSEMLKCEADIHSFLIVRLTFIMSLFHLVRQSINSST
jgi:hypothetical protein